MTKLQNTNSDKTQKLILWQNLKFQIVKQIKKSNYDKTQKFNLGQYSKTQIVTKLKNSNWYKTQKLELCEEEKTLIVIKLKTLNVTKLKNSYCENSKCNFFFTKLKNSNSEKKLKLWQMTNILGKGIFSKRKIFNLILWIISLKPVCKRKKSRIRETPSFSTDEDSSTNIFVSAGVKKGADSKFFFANFFFYQTPLAIVFVAAASQWAFEQK